MTPVLGAVIPIVAILLLGKLISRTSVLSAEGWLGLESITYFVLFPALIVSKLAVADFSSVDWRMPTVLIGAQCVVAVVSFILAKVLSQPENRIGVLIQSGVRWNTFIALAFAQDILGPMGVALIAVAAAAMVPTSNLISILALVRFANSGIKFLGILKQVVMNPLILAFVLGLSLNQLGIGLHPSFLSFLEILAQAAIALGLLATGSHIQFRDGGAPLATIFGWSLLRLLALPLIAGSLAVALGTPALIVMIILIATAVPTASNGTILARKLGGDARLAANLIALQTLLAVVTMTGIFWAAEAIGII